MFTIQGGYSSVRHSLRRRGWVEKFYNITSPLQQSSLTAVKKPAFRDDDCDAVEDGDDDDDDGTDDDDVDSMSMFCSAFINIIVM